MPRYILNLEDEAEIEFSKLSFNSIVDFDKRYQTLVKSLKKINCNGCFYDSLHELEKELDEDKAYPYEFDETMDLDIEIKEEALKQIREDVEQGNIPIPENLCEWCGDGY